MLDGSPPVWIDGDDASNATACLASAVERLRSVRAAHARFLALWAVDHMLADPDASARARSDLDAESDNHWAEASINQPWCGRPRFVD